MPERIDLFDSTYQHFTERTLDAIRKDTFGVDIGQNSWLTVDEYDRLLPQLALAPTSHVLEVASGSGGPALYVARTFGCRVTGIDANESGIATASKAAAAAGLGGQVEFRDVDATGPLPFDEAAFDALICIDSMNHSPDRAGVLREWRRVLRPGAVHRSGGHHRSGDQRRARPAQLDRPLRVPAGRPQRSSDRRGRLAPDPARGRD
jgi:SAM-dependent methyltransferase